MHCKYPAFALREMAIEGSIACCEIRSFAAHHSCTLNASNHEDFVDAFLLQLSSPAQHETIISLLSSCERDFRGGKIAYRPPGSTLITSVLDVGRWVSSQLEGGLTNAHVLDRAERVDVGETRAKTPLRPVSASAQKVIALLEGRQVVIPRSETLDLIATRTSLLSDLAMQRSLTGDNAAAVAVRKGEICLFQLFDRGTKDRKELELLICSALRDRAHILAFTSNEFLLDQELVSLLGEGDRLVGGRRADAYIVAEEGNISFDSYLLSSSTGKQACFFKTAHRLGLVVGVSIKSDFGFQNKRSTSGELHIDRCPIVLFAIPRFNNRAGSMSDVVVCANALPRFSVSEGGSILYVGPAMNKSSLYSLNEVRAWTRRSLATIRAKMTLDGWHEVLLFSMGASWAAEADDWPSCAKKRPLVIDLTGDEE